MLTSKQHNFIYYPIPKSGSTSIIQVLESSYNATAYDPGWEEHHKSIPDRYAIRTVPKEFESAIKFTVCRNPYDRAVSIWWHLVISPLAYRYKYLKQYGNCLKDFEYFLGWLKPRIKTVDRIGWLASHYIRGIQLDKIIKLCDLDIEFKKLKFYTGIPAVFPKCNVSIGKNRAKHLNVKTRKLIVEIFAKDFETFGYPK